ncbi:putative FMN-binding domain protein [Trueperella bernardiae]|uniref:Putative FMN-binding domain protein n=1 Tax=Trueperella bernardiae TaxID=59561 RepID=A0A0W1KMC2_9ACTO|nr:FMN-binding negative transcriptional regulator [Trueperella bernardiae]KTF04652.1 putative FMN-binding domain protein [Trueperella bernardiae]MDV6238784.1 FMN-binding negative transcriptional regulator [Trueperella bernardiae]
MYVAQQHAMDRAAALGFAGSIGVGQLVSVGAGGLNATYLPFNIVECGGKVVAQFHLNRVNPQWRDAGEAMLIVQGPSAHVSGLDLPAERPGAKLPTVPTLNYVTVHLRGSLSIHDDTAWKQAHLTALVEHFEREWRVGQHTSYELVHAAFAAMVGVELEVAEVIGKAKLSQNLSAEGIAETARHLRERDESACPVADLMEEIAIPWAKEREGRVEGARKLPIAWDKKEDPRRYVVDYGWLWEEPPHNDGTPAVLRLVLTDGAETNARAAAEEWLAGLPQDGGMPGRGGWAVKGGVVECEHAGAVGLDLVSAGEDVADGISAAAEDAFANLIASTDLGVRWEQLPREESHK